LRPKDPSGGEILREGHALYLVRFQKNGIAIVFSKNRAQDDRIRVVLIPTLNNLSSSSFPKSY